MASITTYSNEHWAVSADVTGDKLDIPHKGDPTDVEKSIESATKIVQGWWVDETGLDYPDDLPDPSSLEEGNENATLGDATAYMTASLEHEKQTENVRSTTYESDDRQDNPERKYIFLERTAERLFDSWLTLNGYDDPGGPEDGDDGFGTPEAGIGRIGALVDIPARDPDYEERHWGGS